MSPHLPALPSRVLVTQTQVLRGRESLPALFQDPRSGIQQLRKRCLRKEPQSDPLSTRGGGAGTWLMGSPTSSENSSSQRRSGGEKDNGRGGGRTHSLGYPPAAGCYLALKRKRAQRTTLSMCVYGYN